MSGPARIEIQEHDTEWSAVFDSERSPIALALGIPADCVIHVGSTSVPGLAAKPIVDIQAEVPTLSSRTFYDAALGALGFTSIDSGENDLRIAMRKRRDISANLHIVVQGSWTARRTLLFKDALRADATLVVEYARLKRRLAASETDLDAYTLAKTEFIESVIEKRARESGITYTPGNRR